MGADGVWSATTGGGVVGSNGGTPTAVISLSTAIFNLGVSSGSNGFYYTTGDGLTNVGPASPEAAERYGATTTGEVLWVPNDGSGKIYSVEVPVDEWNTGRAGYTCAMEVNPATNELVIANACSPATLTIYWVLDPGPDKDPLTISDNSFRAIKGTNGGLTYTGAISDMTLDAQGNIYNIVGGNLNGYIVRVSAEDGRAMNAGNYTGVGATSCAPNMASIGFWHGQIIAMTEGTVACPGQAFNPLTGIAQKADGIIWPSFGYRTLDGAGTQGAVALSGTVKDQSGTPVPNQTIAYYRDNGDGTATLVKAATTNASGGYASLFDSNDQKYYVRLVQPSKSADLKGTVTSIDTSLLPENSGTATTLTALNVGEGVDPALGTIGSTITVADVSALAAFDVKDAKMVGVADFNVKYVGSPSASKSEWVITPATAQPVGEEFTATVTVKDSVGTTVDAGQEAQFTLPADVTVVGGGSTTVITDANGQATIKLTSTKVGTYSVQAKVKEGSGNFVHVGGSAASGTKSIEFIVGAADATASMFSVSDGDRVANGIASHTATADVKDAHGNSVSGTNVIFEVPADVAATVVSGTLISNEDGTVVVTSNGSGVAAISLTSTKANTYTVSGSISDTPMTGSPKDVTFVAGPVDASKSDWVITPGTAQQVGSEFTAVVTVKDAQGNAVGAGVEVQFALPADVTVVGGGSTTVTTDANGQATLKVTSTKVGTYSVEAKIGETYVGGSAATGTKSIEFIAGTADATASAFSVSDGDRVANGTASHTATADVKDAFGNSVSGVAVAFEVPADVAATVVSGTLVSNEDGTVVVTSNGSGVAAISLTSTKANTYTIGASIGTDAIAGSPKDVTFVAGPVDASKSDWSISPASPQVAGSTYTATVNVKDAQGNVVTAPTTVSFEIPADINDGPEVVAVDSVDGVATLDLHGEQAGSYDIVAKIGGGFVGGTSESGTKSITYVADSANASTSTLFVSGGTVEADGNATHSATATVRDQYGNVLGAGIDVIFTLDPALNDGAGTATVATDANGQAKVELTSLTAGTFDVSAALGGAEIKDSPGQAKFGAGAGVAANSSWIVTPAGPLAAGGDYTATVTVRDANLNVVEDAVVTFEFPADVNGGIMSATATTGTDGTATYTFSSEKAGAYDVSAKLGSSLIQDGTKSLEWVAGAADASASTIEASKSPILADDSDSSLITVQLRDQYGNDLTTDGDTVTIATSHGDITGVTAVGNGRYTATLTGKAEAVGEATLTFTVNDEDGADTAEVVIVDATAPDAPIVDPTDGTVVTGEAEPGSTVTIKDGDGNTVCETIADGDGVFSCTPDEPLEDGEYTVTATDEAGNTSPEKPITVDTTAPDAPVVDPTDGTEVTGSAEPGSTVTIKDGDGNTVCETVAAADGTFECTPIPPLEDGDYTATSTDEAGNTSPDKPFTVDTTAPAMPVVDQSDGSEVTGSAEPGSTVTIKDGDGNTVCETVAAADGTFECTPVPPLEDGDYTATATDEAGNVSPEAPFVVDTTAPEMPSVDKSDGTVVTGIAEPGSTVTIKDGDGNTVCETVADIDGEFECSPSTPLEDGNYTATSTDESGNVSPEAPFTVDTTGPEMPVVDQSDGTVVTGEAEPGSTVTIKDDDGNTVCETVADGDGTFECTPDEPLEDGRYTVTATDDDGNSSPEAPFIVDTTAPEAPVVDRSDGTVVTGSAEPASLVTIRDKDGAIVCSTIANVDGPFACTPIPPMEDGDYTATATDEAGNVSPEKPFIVDTTAPAMPVVDQSDGTVVTGSAEPGSTVTIKDGDGNTVCETVADGDGAFECTPDEPLEDGDYTVTATDEDGNVSPETPFTVDTAAPDAPVVDPTDGSEVTGEAEPGSTVTIKDGDGNTVCETVSAADGTFECTPIPPLEDGDYTATSTDEAGNTSPDKPFTVDTTAPAMPVVDRSDGTVVTGMAEPDSLVTIRNKDGAIVCSTITVDADGAFECIPIPPMEDGDYTATATDEAGNVSPEAPFTVDTTAPGAPVVDPTDGSEVTGSAEPGSTVTIKDGDGNTVCETVADGDGAFSCTPIPPLEDGDYTAASTDEAGNTSPDKPFTVDTTAPEMPVVDQSDGTVVTGEAEPGSTVTIKDGDGNTVCETIADGDGAFSCTPIPPLEDGDYTATSTDEAGNTSPDKPFTVDTTAPEMPVVDPTDGSEVTGEAEPGSTVTIKDSDGNTVCETIADGDGVFSCTPDEPLEDGDYTVTATDEDGNVSPEAPFTVDTIAPEMPIVDPTDGTVVTGSAEPGSTVTIKDGDGNTVCVTTVDVDGVFSCTPDEPLEDGNYTATSTDEAGNVSPEAPFTVDTTAPDAPVVDPTDGSEVTGEAEPGSTVTIKDGDGNTVCETVADADGMFSCTPDEPLEDGDYTVTATDEDGNVSPDKPFTVDTVAPDAPVVDPTDGTVVTGEAEPDSKVTIKDKDGNTVCETVADVDGMFSCTPDEPLEDGEYTVTSTDKDGNVSPESPFVVDTTAPQTPKVDPTDGSEVTGEAEPGATVTIKDRDGEILCVTTADKDGKFECELDKPLEKGDLIQVTATDKNGNESEPTWVRVGGPWMELSSDKLRRGETLTIAGHGFLPGESVAASVHSDLVQLGVKNADADGTVVFTFVIPQDFDLGGHTAFLAGEKSGELQQEFEVVAKSVPVTPLDSLPATGAGGLTVLSGTAALLVAAGFLLLFATRRKREEDAATR